MDEVKAAYKKWVLWLHPDKNMNNIAKATHLFKRLTSGYEGWKSAPGVAPPRPAEEPPNYQFNPTYAHIRPGYHNAQRAFSPAE